MVSNSFLKSLLASLVLAAAAVTASPALSMSLSGPANVRGVENLKLVSTITNTGDQPMKILDDPRTLASKRPVDKFTITSTKGGSPAFTGIKVKYSPETAAKMGAYTVLAPGSSMEVDHDLSEAYNFTSPGAGSYKFEPDTTFYVVNPDNTITAIHAETVGSKDYSVEVAGNLAVTRRDESPSHLSKRATFVGCSASRQSSINTAAASAETYAANAYSYLNSHTASTPRFTTWFGAFTAAHRSTVLSHFQLIDSNDFSSFTYDCTCTDSSYAYVYAANFGKIYFCSAFWNAPNTGTDSKAGTIIHESSHFTKNGGTQDYAYGQSAAKSLATSNSARAIMNADSHEYFAENTPAQS